MDTKAAENYLRNTEMKFKFKAGSAMAIALTLLMASFFLCPEQKDDERKKQDQVFKILCVKLSIIM